VLEVKPPWSLILSMVFFALIVGALARNEIISATIANGAVAILCFVPAVWYVLAYWNTRAEPLYWGLAVNAVGWMAAGLSFLFIGSARKALFVMAAVCIIVGGVVGFYALRNDPESPLSDRT